MRRYVENLNPDDAAAKKKKADAAREAPEAMTLAYNNGDK
jgi:hypothetical protein